MTKHFSRSFFFNDVSNSTRALMDEPSNSSHDRLEAVKMGV